MPTAGVESRPARSRRWVEVVAALAIAAALLAFAEIKIDSIASGAIQPTRSDDSGRAQWAHNVAIDPSIPLSTAFFTNVWPFGPPIIQAAFLRAVYGLGLDAGLHYTQWLLILTCAVYTLAAAIYCALAWRLAGPLAGVVMALVAVGTVVPTQLSTSAFAEPYAMLFVALGAWCFVSCEEDGRGAALSGFWLLLAQLCRSDAILIAAVLGLRLLLQRRWRDAGVFLAISMSFFVAKQIVVLATGYRGMTYANLNEFYRIRERALSQRIASVWNIHVVRGWLIASEPTFTGLAILGLPLALWDRRARSLTWAGLLCVLGLLAMMVLGMITFGPRYAVLGRTLLLLGATVAVTGLVARLAQRSTVSALLSAAVVVSVLGTAAWGNAQYVQRRAERQTPAAIVEAAQWLRAHSQPDDPLFFDFTLAWSSYFLNQTNDFGAVRPSFARSFLQPNRTGFRVPQSDDRGERKTIAAHMHIQQYQPRYLVLAGPQLLRKVLAIDTEAHLRKGLVHSFVRPYLRREEGTSNLIFEPIYRETDAVLVLRPRFRNPMIEIYELERRSAEGSALLQQ